MSVFLLKRALSLLLTLALASAVIFWVLEVLPGDAALVQMGPDASPAAVQALAAQLGLDRPPLQRYLSWLEGLSQGDLGVSYAYGTSVAELVGERLSYRSRIGERSHSAGAGETTSFMITDFPPWCRTVLNSYKCMVPL